MPADFLFQTDENDFDPNFKILGMAAKVSTLFTTVGLYIIPLL